jgi:putative component of toxin-antitoxin plasmid stabilization module
MGKKSLDILSYIQYNILMYDIETTEEFDNWLGGIRDGKTQKVIVKRIRTMSLGTFGKGALDA